MLKEGVARFFDESLSKIQFTYPTTLLCILQVKKIRYFLNNTQSDYFHCGLFLALIN